MINDEIFEALQTVHSYILKLKGATEDIVEDYRSQSFTMVSLLSELIEGINWTIQAISSIHNISSEYEIDFDIEKLTGNISELLEAMENDDDILLADILEYEILEILDKWENEIKGIINSK